MEAHIVTVQVKSEFLERYLEVTRQHAQRSLDNEPGCLRYDLLQDPEDPTRITAYEVFRDKAAFDAHNQAPYNATWHETIDDWRVPGRVHRPGVIVFPPESAWRK